METKRPTNPEAEELLNLYFPVLDKGFISLQDYSGTDESIEAAARVSYGFGTRKLNQTRGLLRYLLRNHHTSPFEMVQLKFHLCMPIFVARQIFRHRSSSANEISGRYSVIPTMFYTPDAEHFNKQSQDNKQGRGEELPSHLYQKAVEQWEDNRHENTLFYQDLLDIGVAREIARIDLPLSTYTQFVWSMDIHNLLHFLNLRCDAHAQYETREYANVMAAIVKRVAPLTFEAWMDYQFGGSSFSRMELDFLRSFLSPGKNNDGEDVVWLTQDPRKFNFNKPEISEFGLSGREIEELLLKLNPKEILDFELDITTAKSAEYFQELIETYVLPVDK